MQSFIHIAISLVAVAVAASNRARVPGLIWIDAQGAGLREVGDQLSCLRTILKFGIAEVAVLLKVPLFHWSQ